LSEGERGTGRNGAVRIAGRTLVLSVYAFAQHAGMLLSRLFRRDPVHSRGSGGFEIIVVSQVPWDYLWQRNHHTMARISQSAKVLYATPIPTVTAAKEGKTIRDLSAGKHGENLMHYRPLVLWGDSRCGAVRALNRDFLRNSLASHARKNGMGGRSRVLWFYSPTFGSLAGRLGEDLVVYDIQDEYSAFSWYPRDTAERERALLSKCDLVFTGTLQLRKNKEQYNRRIHFVQCGVESDHFSMSREESVTVPDDVSGIPKPVLGYFGLVDGRLDIAMLEEVAKRRPDWNILLIGPAHIATSRPNIFMIGKREYRDLPRYLRAFDICLIPFVMNENTRNLNPTKLLEYFASGKPVISAPIPDIMELYPDLVEFAATPEEFIAAAAKLISGEGEEKRRRRIREAAGNSWESMVEKMLSHLERTFGEKAAWHAKPSS
jgi:glycosyltransferase involved in cell wall biosynthesis